MSASLNKINGRSTKPIHGNINYESTLATGLQISLPVPALTYTVYILLIMLGAIKLGFLVPQTISIIWHLLPIPSPRA